jgi:hypothetical protein
MATVKKLNGNYVIQTPFKTGASSNITLDTDNVYVTGNLTVKGNTTVIESNTQIISDNIIILNYGESGNGVSTLGTTSGIEIDRGTAPGENVQLVWNEGYKTWQVSGVTAGSPGDGTKYSNIATTTGAAAIASVFEDKYPVLGGNLNVNGFTIYSNVAASSYVALQGALQLKQANVVYTAATGSTVFYANVVGAGQTGLYVINTESTNEELVTKRRAFGFSLIL